MVYWSIEKWSVELGAILQTYKKRKEFIMEDEKIEVMKPVEEPTEEIFEEIKDEIEVTEDE